MLCNFYNFDEADERIILQGLPVIGPERGEFGLSRVRGRGFKYLWGDAEYDARKEFFKNKQKQWLDEQIEEKRLRKEQEKLEDQMYSNQTNELNRMRGMLEDNFQKTKGNIHSNVTQFNQQLNLEQKQKADSEKQAHKQYQKEEVDYLKTRGAKQEFYMDVK